MRYYTLKHVNQVMRGQTIRYIGRKLTKLSVTGIVLRIDYYDSIVGNKLEDIQIKNILLYSGVNKNFWLINPKKYYIFISNRVGSTSDAELINFLKTYIHAPDDEKSV